LTPSASITQPKSAGESVAPNAVSATDGTSGSSGRRFPISDFSLSDISGRRTTDANGKGC
jgi:hypothetical protein